MLRDSHVPLDIEETRAPPFKEAAEVCTGGGVVVEARTMESNAMATKVNADCCFMVSTFLDCISDEKTVKIT